jgi:hypothetical protein
MEAERWKREERVGDGEDEDGGWRMEDGGGGELGEQARPLKGGARGDHQLSDVMGVRWKVALSGSGWVLARQ